MVVEPTVAALHSLVSPGQSNRRRHMSKIVCPWWQATLLGRRSTKLALASNGLFGPAIGYNSSIHPSKTTRPATRSVLTTSILGLQIEKMSDFSKSHFGLWKVQIHLQHHQLTQIPFCLPTKLLQHTPWCRRHA